MREQSWTLSWILLYLLLGTAVLLPAELHPAGLVIQTALSGGFFWLLLRQPSPVPPQSCLGIPLLMAAALLPSILHSSQRHTSAVGLFHLFPAVAGGAGATLLSVTRQGRERFVALMIALGTAVSLWGICQTTFSLNWTARYLRSLGRSHLARVICGGGW